jgi:branched-chain amino acid transport system substrate-binding protein
VAAYKDRYEGKTPDATAALGYDSAMILCDAFKRAGAVDGPKVRDALASTANFDGVTGKFTINRNRDAEKAVVIVQVRKGKFCYVKTVQPPSSDLPPIGMGPSLQQP